MEKTQSLPPTGQPSSKASQVSEQMAILEDCLDQTRGLIEAVYQRLENVRVPEPPTEAQDKVVPELVPLANTIRHYGELVARYNRDLVLLRELLEN